MFHVRLATGVVLFFKIRVDEIERHVLRSTGPLVFLGRERIELRLNLTRSPGDPLCPPSKISPPFNLIS